MKLSIKEETVCATTAVLLVLISGLLSLTTADTILDVSSISNIVPELCTAFTASDEVVLGGSNQDHRFCSVLTASYGEKVLFGGNVDDNPRKHSGTTPRIFFFPASADGYSFVAFGWSWEEKRKNYKCYTCGMNEEGLAFGTSGVPDVPLNPHSERPFSISSELFSIKAMRGCSDVSCVIEMAKTFDWGSSISIQYHFADSAGGAVVISAGEDGELAFTGRDKAVGYLVSTNFNRANPKNGKYPCWRYDTAVSMLKEIEYENDLTLDYFGSILDAIHVEGIIVNTVYSYVFDLHTGDIHVYYFHQFEEVVKFNLEEEMANLSKGLYCLSEPLTNRFSQETVDKATSEFQEYQRQVILIVAFSVAGLSGVYFFIHKNMRNRRKEESD